MQGFGSPDGARGTVQGFGSPNGTRGTVQGFGSPDGARGTVQGFGSPDGARGTVQGALARFPLLAGGTCRRGFSNACVSVKFGLVIGITCETEAQ